MIKNHFPHMAVLSSLLTSSAERERQSFIRLRPTKCLGRDAHQNEFWFELRSTCSLRPWLLFALFNALAISSEAQSDRVVIASSPGYSITWDGNNGGFSSPEPGAIAPDNPVLASNGASAFGSTAYLPGGIHDFPNVIDGFYGNSSSWISDFRIPDTNAFIGVAFGKSVSIRSIAWSRDNGDDTERTPSGPYTDRSVGIYTLQVTAVSNPGVDTAETGDPTTGWVNVGTVQYKPGTDNIFFSAYLRHRFDVSAANQPIPSTGLRIKVSDGGTDIDEIEVNSPADPSPPIATFIAITNAPGYSIDWNGRNGEFSNTNSPALAPNNRALAGRGTTAFGSSEYGHGIHFITNVIDGLYGNSHSWISDFTKPDTNAFIGLNFGGRVDLKTIAWSRDNGDTTEGPCAGGTCTDRSLGVYTLQVTQVANPGVNTTETGDPATGWVTIGTVDYKTAGASFVPYLRHQYSVTQGGNPISASGLRIKLSDGNLDIDEIEVNPNAALLARANGLIVISSSAGYSIDWDGNDGDFFSPNPGARAPNNDALASNGSKAFGSGQYFPDGGIHDIDNVIDGLYGNSHSWITGPNEIPLNLDPAAGTYIGVNFGKTIPVGGITWGRANGDTLAGCCTDRWPGDYTLQITTLANPDAGTVETGDPATGWATIGTVSYNGQAAPDFNPWLRHRYDVATSTGTPIKATGLRIKVSSDATDIDEIEVNPSSIPPPGFLITSSGGYTIAYDGNDGLFGDTNSPAPAVSNLALAINGTTAFGSSEFGNGVHFITNIIDGLYGNKHSWISDFTKPDTNAFVGVSFGKSVAIRSVAWGRDNGDNTEGPSNPNKDRSIGIYTIQATSVSSPGTSTSETGDPATGWATVGTVHYLTENQFFHPYLRHRFDLKAGTDAVLATGLRIKVSDGNLDIDELEINPQENIKIKSASGFAISWDGNDGEFFSPDVGAAPPDNLALATEGTAAFGSSELDFGGIHLISHINDGLYGNSHSWISDRGVGGGSDTNPFVGLSFGKTITITNLAWSRANGDKMDIIAGCCDDRSLGVYTLQVSTVANPGVDTPETGDPASGWSTIGTIEYLGQDASFHPWLRHRFAVTTDNGTGIQATGFRMKVSDGNIDIDEIEIDTAAASAPPQTPRLSVVRQAANIVISWTGAGALQSSDTVNGQYSDVPGATNPTAVSVTLAKQRFYRVKQ